MEELLSQVQSGVASHRAHSDWTEAAAVGWREKQAWLLWPWLMNESSAGLMQLASTQTVR
jgi:hypothetical protein